jgi:tetratricopeptide (TPR) repeat protein
MKPRLAPGAYLLVVLAASVFPPTWAEAQSGPMQQTSRGVISSGRTGTTYSITGRVLDEATSKPVEGARVMLTGSIGVSLQEVYVDMTGMFRFTEVARGSYYVTASAYGYEDARELIQVMGAPAGGVYLYLRPKASAALPVQIEPLDVDQRLIPKDARKALMRGVSELRRGKFAEALAQLDKALAIYPKYATAWHTKGLVHLQLGEIDSARSSFEAAVAANPDTAAPRVFLGGIYNADHRYTEALEHLQKALQFSPRSGLAHFEISRTYWAMGDVDNCEKHISEAHELNPRIPQVHMVRANVFLARGSYQQALKELDEFLEFVPGVVPEGQLAAYVRHQRAQIVARLDSSPR